MPIKKYLVRLADETGSVNASFIGPETALLTKDAVIAVRNGISAVIRGHIEIRIDRFGKVTSEPSKKIAAQNEPNHSSKEFELRKGSRRR